jgi:hypothetical protein
MNHSLGETVTSTVMVPFEGQGGGVAELSWGQAEMWRAIADQQSWMPLGGPAELPPAKDIEDIIAAMRWMLGRHRSLRTRLRFDPDGGVRQEVADHGDVPLHVVDVPDDGDPARVAADVDAGFRRADLDYEHEWPLRMAVVRQRGVITHLVGEFCHLALDIAGMAALFRGGLSTLLLTETDAATLPVTDALDPLDQVAWQRGPAGRRHNQAVQRYWTRQLARVPAGRFGASDDERQPRHWQATLRSPSAYRAVWSITARTAVDSSAVLLAAAAMAMTRATGRDPAVFQIAVGNRFRPGLADSVSSIGQSCVCVIDVADAPFDEVLARAARRARNAYLNAYFDREQMEALIAEIGRARGERIDLTCFFNDRRAPDNRTPNRTAPAHESPAETTVTWGPHSDTPFAPLFVHINDTAQAVVELLLQADTRYFPPAHMRTFLSDFEATLLAAATFE